MAACLEDCGNDEVILAIMGTALAIFIMNLTVGFRMTYLSDISEIGIYMRFATGAIMAILALALYMLNAIWSGQNIYESLRKKI